MFYPDPNFVQINEKYVKSNCKNTHNKHYGEHWRLFFKSVFDKWLIKPTDRIRCVGYYFTLAPTSCRFFLIWVLNYANQPYCITSQKYKIANAIFFSSLFQYFTTVGKIADINNMRLITYNHQYCRDLGRGVGVILGHIDNTYYMYNTQKIMTFLLCEKPHESKIT